MSNSNMDVDVMAQTNYGKAALRKMGAVPPNFRLYYAGFLGDKPQDWSSMAVIGAEFRVAKRGKNAGKLCIMVPGTTRRVVVSKKEIAAADQMRGKPRKKVLAQAAMAE